MRRTGAVPVALPAVVRSSDVSIQVERADCRVNRDMRASQVAALVGTIATTLMHSGCKEAEATARPSRVLSIEAPGVSVRAPLKVMNVYLFDVSGMREVYEIFGEGVGLFGKLPANVGYGEAWERLIGKTIRVDRAGGMDDHRDSFITLSGGDIAEVLEGGMLVERVSGSTSGQDGDMTLSGKIRLRIRTLVDGDLTVEGTFAVHCVTWG